IRHRDGGRQPRARPRRGLPGSLEQDAGGGEKDCAADNPPKGTSYFHATSTSRVLPATSVPFTCTAFGFTTRRLNGVPSRPLKSPSMILRESALSMRPTYSV